MQHVNKKHMRLLLCKGGVFLATVLCVFSEFGGGVPAAHALRFEALTEGFSNLFGEGDEVSVSGIFNSLFLILISVGAVLAILRIAIGGIKYMFSESFTTKEAAKKDLQGSILGLLIILSVVLVFEQINDNILDLDVFEGAPEAPVTEFVPAGAPTTPQQTQTAVNSAQDCFQRGGRVVRSTRVMGRLVVDCEIVNPTTR